MKLPEPVPLRVQRDELSRRLAERLAGQAPLQELHDLRTRLQMLDEAIAASAPRRPAWRRHLLALAVVGALVSLAALWPMPRTSFALTVEAGSAQLRMAAAGALQGDVVDQVLRAEGFARLASADTTLVQRAADEGSGQLALQAQRLRLRRVGYSSGTQLEMEGGLDTVRVAIDRGPSVVEIDFGGDAALSLGAGPPQPRHVEVAEWIRLVSDKAPAELWLGRSGSHAYQWRGLQPQALAFVERQADPQGEARLVSSVQGGEVQLPATDRRTALAAGEGLVLEGLSLERAELTLGDRVTLKASGSARRIEVETAGVRRSLAPSLLEYLARNHTLGLLWSSAGLLWGMVAWLRKAVDDKAA